MTTALNLTKSIYDSQTKLNQDGNVANLAIKSLNNMDSEIIPKNLINNENYHSFPKEKTLQFNLNGIDIDIYKKFNTFLEKVNFLNMFPYERKDLLTHKEKKRIYNKDFENLDKYLSWSAGQLNFNGKRNPNDLTKYAYAMLFFNLDNSTILTDPRNLVFDYNEKNNNWKFSGYWNEGNMLNEIRMFIIQMQYYNENPNNNTSNNSSYLSLYKEVNKNVKQSDFVLNTISGDSGAKIINVKLRDPTYELHKDFWLSDIFFNYFKQLKIVKNNYDIPNDKYEPYL